MSLNSYYFELNIIGKYQSERFGSLITSLGYNSGSSEVYSIQLFEQVNLQLFTHCFC
jgi:hypothetical protein